MAKDSHNPSLTAESAPSSSSGSLGGLEKPEQTQRQQIDQLAAEYGVDQRRLMLKIDCCIIPPICLLYLLAFLDRINVSNAKVYGLVTDLGLEGNQFNVALTIFFVPYIVFEIVSNYLLKLFKPHVWLTACILLFGATTIGMGFVHNYGALLACRFLLGIFESGMFPGCFYLLSMWYRRDEGQKRYSFFFASTNLAGAFGGLIAYGINHLDGSRGIEGWRWIFIIEGAITCFCSLFLFFVLADFPEDARFLSNEEKAFIKAKLALDVGESSHELKVQWREIAGVFKDANLWLVALVYFALVIPSYGYAYFAPTIIQTFGYSPVQTQLHSVWPWICTFGVGLTVGVLSDWTRRRFPFFVFATVLAVIGFAILLGVETNQKARYAACFLVVTGCYTAMPIFVCWSTMNFSGHLRRSVATAWQIGFGNIGGIIATFSFMAPDAPLYTKGVGLGLAFVCFSIIVGTVYFLWCRHLNKWKASAEYYEQFEQWPERRKQQAGDLVPGFRYTF